MYSSLSEQEREVLGLLRSTLSRREACKRLHLTEDEVAAIWKGIGDKLSSREPEKPEDLEALLAYEKVERYRLEGEVWAAEARLNALMDTSPDIIFLIQGQSGRILTVNNAAVKALGYTPAELVGEVMEMLVPNEKKEIHVSYRRGFLNSVRKREMGYHPPIKALCKDGSILDLDIALTATQATDDVMVVCRVRNAVAVGTESDVALFQDT